MNSFPDFLCNKSQQIHFFEYFFVKTRIYTMQKGTICYHFQNCTRKYIYIVFNSTFLLLSSLILMEYL